MERLEFCERLQKAFGTGMLVHARSVEDLLREAERLEAFGDVESLENHVHDLVAREAQAGHAIHPILHRLPKLFRTMPALFTEAQAAAGREFSS